MQEQDYASELRERINYLIKIIKINIHIVGLIVATIVAVILRPILIIPSVVIWIMWSLKTIDMNQFKQLNIELQNLGYTTKVEGSFNNRKIFASKENFELKISNSKSATYFSRKRLELRSSLHFQQNIIIGSRSFASLKYSQFGKHKNRDLERMTQDDNISLILSELFKMGVYETSEIKQNENVFTIIIEFQIYLIKNLVNKIEELIWYLMNGYDFDKIIDEEDKINISYKCNQCSQIISFKGRNCVFCKYPAPICIICFVDPEPLDQVSILTCCDSYVHTKHIENWIKLKNVCPYCLTTKPIISEIKDLDLN